MEEVVRGAGEVNLWSGDASFDIASAADSAGDGEQSLGGVSGCAFSVVGISESWYCVPWDSILPQAQLAQAVRHTSGRYGGGVWSRRIALCPVQL